MLRLANWKIGFLILTICLPLLWILIYFGDRIRKKALDKFGNSELIYRAILRFDPKKRRWRRVFLTVGLIMLCFAFARPQLGTKLEKVTREGIDIIFALDISKSMLAEDFRPNRLAMAKHKISSFVEGLSDDRVGLVVFAGDAFLMCPLTLDYDAFLMFLDAVDIGIVDEPGTNISRAIEIAMKGFVQGEFKHKVLILITDGEQTTAGDPIAMAKRASQEGIKIFTIGVGSQSGAPVPVKDEAGQTIGYRKDENDVIVTSKLDEKLLDEIALTSDGQYFPARQGKEEIDQILMHIDKMTKKELEGFTYSSFEDIFYYPLVVSILLLWLYFSLPERKNVSV